MSILEFAGARIELGDAAGLLASAGAVFESVLQPAGSTSGLPSIAVLIARGLPTGSGQPVLRLRARIRTRAQSFEGPLHPAIVGAAYVGPIVDALTKLIDPARADEDQRAEKTDAQTGLSATVTYGRAGFDGLVTDTLESVVDAGDAAADQLAAFVRLAFDLARHQAGGSADDAFFAGRVYRLSREVPPSTASTASPGSAASPAGAGDDLDEPGRVRLDQLGGLDTVVQQLRDVADSFRHPEVMARWGARRPQGILMWGPPGTGKTTLATALATEIGGTLREVRTPDILSKWVGSSERNIKKIFTEARGYRTPTVLLFDEFDSIISYNGSPQSAADQVSNSVAGLFKQEMNGLIDANPNVIVVATTNFPRRVDDSLIRSGRFDVKISVPLPDATGRADILRKMLARLVKRHDHGEFRIFADDVDVAELAEVSLGMSGADLKELLRRVQMAKAMEEARGGTVTPITQADLKREIAAMLLSR